MTLYPIISTIYNEKHQSQIHTQYQEQVKQVDGHFVDDVDGNWWVIYHAYENGHHSVGRKLLLSPVEFTADGWFTVSTPPHVATKKPAGFNVSSAEILSDNFKHEASQPTQWRSKGILDISRITRDGSGLHFRGVSTYISFYNNH